MASTPKPPPAFETDPDDNEYFTCLTSVYRRPGFLADFTIHVQGEAIHCHRVVLAAHDTIFGPLFKAQAVAGGSVCRELVVPGLEAWAVRAAVDWLYTRRLAVSYARLRPVLAAARAFRVVGLTERALDYVAEHIGVEDCLAWYEFGHNLKWSDLCEIAMVTIRLQFEDVCRTEKFLSLGDVQIVQECCTPETVPEMDSHLTAIFAWLSRHEDRHQHIDRLLAVIRIEWCSPRVVNALLKTHPDIVACSKQLRRRMAVSRGMLETPVATGSPCFCRSVMRMRSRTRCECKSKGGARRRLLDTPPGGRQGDSKRRRCLTQKHIHFDDIVDPAVEEERNGGGGSEGDASSGFSESDPCSEDAPHEVPV